MDVFIKFAAYSSRQLGAVAAQKPGFYTFFASKGNIGWVRVDSSTWKSLIPIGLNERGT